MIPVDKFKLISVFIGWFILFICLFGNAPSPPPHVPWKNHDKFKFEYPHIFLFHFELVHLKT